MNDDIIDSERLDLPSASDARARRMCPGRYQLIQHLKRTGKVAKKALYLGQSADGRYATFGSKVHSAWAGETWPDGVTLSTFESETLEKLQRLEQLVLTDFAAGREVRLFAREQRLWLHKGITPIHSGRYDVAYVTGDMNAMLIIDGKTLTVPVAPADTNDQLRELVALAHFNYPGIKEFTVAILQPNVERPTSMATYDELEAELALRLLRWHLDDIQNLDLPRVYGDWCKYCPAMEFCPEARRAIEPVLAHQLETQDGKLTLTIGQEGATFLRRLVTAKGIIETMLEAYKAFLSENPDEIPGWRLSPGKSKRSVKDVYAAYSVLQDSIELRDFLAATNISISKLQAAYGEVTGAKGKALRDAFNARLADVIEFRADSPSLEDTQS